MIYYRKPRLLPRILYAPLSRVWEIIMEVLR